jgi:hypothetical protein
MRKPPWWSLSFFVTALLVTLSIGSGGFTVVRDLYFYSEGQQPPQQGLLTFLQVCSILAAWGLWLRERNARLQGTKPRLRVPPDGFHQTRPFWKSGTHDPDEQFSSLVLHVENDPAVPTADSFARQVNARLTFCRIDGTELFDFAGRWSDSIQPGQVPFLPTIELNAVEIPIGARRTLDVVLKNNTTDIECYGVNNDSFGHQRGKNPGWQLGPGDYLVKVRFRGIGVDQTFLLQFRNPEGLAPLKAISCKPLKT